MKAREITAIIFFMTAILVSSIVGFWKTPELLGLDGGHSLANYTARYAGAALMFWLTLFSLVAITRRLKIF